MKQFKPTDIVKFVPYYTSGGMQGASLKKCVPKHNCYAIVLSTSRKNVVVLLPNGNISSFSKAHVELV